MHAAIQANILTPIHQQYLFYQLLKAVNFMHYSCILHRDLKPANLLLNADSVLKGNLANEDFEDVRWSHDGFVLDSLRFWAGSHICTKLFAP